MADTSRIEELRRRVQMDPASIAFAALAEEYRRAGQFDEAIATCEAGLQRHPAYLSARVTLGRSLIEIGRYTEAQEQLEHVLRVAPENLAAIRGLAEIHHRRDELPEPIEQHKAGTAAPPLQQPAPVVAPSVAEPPAEPVVASPPPGIPPRVERIPVAAAPPSPPPRTPAAEAVPDTSPPRVVHAPFKPVAVSRPGAPGTSTTSPQPAASVAPPPAHPDAGALPALEDFLAAILRAKADLPSRRSGQ